MPHDYNVSSNFIIIFNKTGLQLVSGPVKQVHYFRVWAALVMVISKMYWIALWTGRGMCRSGNLIALWTGREPYISMNWSGRCIRNIAVRRTLVRRKHVVPYKVPLVPNTQDCQLQMHNIGHKTLWNNCLDISSSWISKWRKWAARLMR